MVSDCPKELQFERGTGTNISFLVQTKHTVLSHSNVLDGKKTMIHGKSKRKERRDILFGENSYPLPMTTK